MSEQNCGSCRLYGANFYRGNPYSTGDRTCCADAVMDLPASFIPGRQTMAPADGAGCIAWDALAPSQPTHEGEGGCEGCPPVGYPTDKTRCLPCPRRAALNPEPSQ